MNPATGAPPEQFLPLSLSVFHILLSLCDQERHGYGIMKEVRARTDGEVRLAPGLLYGNLKRLIDQGLIEKSNERPDAEFDDERRRYYRLTAFGQRVAAAETQRLAKLMTTARAKRLLIGPKLAESRR